MAGSKALHILIAEDNDDEAFLFEHTFKRLQLSTTYRRVKDGREVINYLCGLPPFEDSTQNPFPTLLMLDLKMPGLSGFDVLRWLKHHPECSVIPTHVFSSSATTEDIARAYRDGANTYFCKPADLGEFTDLLRTICQFWHMAEWPSPPRTHKCIPSPLPEGEPANIR